MLALLYPHRPFDEVVRGVEEVTTATTAHVWVVERAIPLAVPNTHCGIEGGYGTHDQVDALDVLPCLMKVDTLLGGILTLPILPLYVRVALPKHTLREIVVEGVTEGSAVVRYHCTRSKFDTIESMEI